MAKFAKSILKIIMILSLVCFIQTQSLDTNNCGEKFSTRMDRNVFKNQKLRSRVIGSYPISKSFECHVKCMQNCRCLSYNVCNKGKLCELNSEKKENNISLYGHSDECDYHGYEFTKQTSSEKCFDPCCTTSNPCLLGGRCTASCMKNNKRFKCECPDGFVGDRCDVKARSCASYLQSSNKKPGLRVIYSPNNITVFCHFSPHHAMTLVMSYSRENNGFYQKESLTKNTPRNETTQNWADYRMSLAAMQNIRDDSSTHWMFTCNYNVRGLVETDYLRSKFSDTDVLIYIGDGLCNNLAEKIDIRGQSCIDCPRNFAQDSESMFHLNGKNINCGGTLDVKRKLCRYTQVRYFGVYICVSTEFSCTQSPTSTTQLWFARKIN